jgi:hypothetical protein
MPIAKLEFNLPDERHEFDQACRAGDYVATLSDVLNHIRQRLKYEKTTKGQADDLEAIRRIIYDSLPGADLL